MQSFDQRLPRWLWPALCALVALVALHGVFSASEIFFVRDLGAYYWSQHLWARVTMLSGEIPLWDPHVAYGQPAVVDPVRHLLFLPVLVLRLVASDVVGFNLSVALPFPLAALGAFLFFRRHMSASGAALAGCAFVLSGPVLSTGNMLNLSWTMALVPWVFWSVDRLKARRSAGRFAALACVFALQAFAGEAVVLLCTGLLAVLYAALGPGESLESRDRARLALLTVGAGVAGGLLASVQLVPLAAALVRSARGEGAVADGWSVHPLSTVEVVAPFFFGDINGPAESISLWVPPLNSQREPFLLSLYLGVGMLMLALLGVRGAGARRWRVLWTAVAAAGFLLSLGYYTPVYAALREVVPGMSALRYPAKYFLFTAFGLAALAGGGWDAIAEAEVERRRRWILSVAAASLAVGAIGVLWMVVPTLWEGATQASLVWTAGYVGVRDADAAAGFAMEALVAHGARLLAVSLAVAGALWLCSRSSALGVAARWGLYALVVGDLLFTHINVNPTMSADLLSTPSWVASTREHPTDRIYIGRGERSVEGLTIDAPPTLDANPNAPPTVVAALRLSTLSFMPSGYGVREPISRDMSALRSAEYLMMSSQFHQPGQGAERGRFLARTATRYYMLGAPPIGDFRLVADIPNLSPLAVYELTSVRPRAVVAPDAVVEPDLTKHVLAMMSAEFDPQSAALLETDPPDPSGSAGPGVAAAAAIEGESANTVTIRAGAPDGGGYLVLMDSYDPGWTAEVDGQDAPVLKADGLFRAVRLAPGEHVVRFEYRPVSLYVGAAVSLATALGLLLASWWARRRPMRA